MPATIYDDGSVVFDNHLNGAADELCDIAIVVAGLEDLGQVEGECSVFARTGA